MKLSYGLIGLGLIGFAFETWVVMRGGVVMPYTRDVFLIFACPLVVGVVLEVIERTRRR